MGNANRTVLVHVHKEGKDYKFSMSGYDVTGDEIVCSKAGMKKSADNMITFEIANHDTNLLFPSKASRAMWVGDDENDCPPSQPRGPHQHIVATSVSGDREQLTVKNANPSIDRYKFCLNFVDAEDGSEETLYQWDPIWDNKNGGSGLK